MLELITSSLSITPYPDPHRSGNPEVQWWLSHQTSTWRRWVMSLKLESATAVTEAPAMADAIFQTVACVLRTEHCTSHKWAQSLWWPSPLWNIIISIKWYSLYFQDHKELFYFISSLLLSGYIKQNYTYTDEALCNVLVITHCVIQSYYIYIHKIYVQLSISLKILKFFKSFFLDFQNVHYMIYSLQSLMCGRDYVLQVFRFWQVFTTRSCTGNLGVLSTYPVIVIKHPNKRNLRQRGLVL